MQLLQYLVGALTLGAIYGLIALGYTMVYGVLRLINFAHGDVFMVGAFAGLFAAARLGTIAPPLWDQPQTFVPLLVVLLAAMVLAAIAGLLIERLAYRPIRNAPRLTLLITAIGVSLLLEYTGQLFFSPDKRGFPELISRAPFYETTNFAIAPIDVAIIGATVFLMLALEWLVGKTRVGRAMRAVALDRPAAALMGINTDRIIALTFAIGSALAGVGGVLQSIYQPQVYPQMGVQVGLQAFVAAVIGGIGNIRGALLGGLLLGAATTAIAASRFSSYRDALAFFILILVLLVRPSGLLGHNVAEKV